MNLGETSDSSWQSRVGCGPVNISSPLVQVEQCKYLETLDIQHIVGMLRLNWKVNIENEVYEECEYHVVREIVF